VTAVSRFFANRMATKCHKCQSNLTAADFDVKAWMRRWSDAALERAQNASLICAAECRRCGGRLTCLGCGKEPKQMAEKPRNVQGHYLSWCCRDGRLFAIWVMLARFDQVVLKIKTAENSKSAQLASKPKGKGTGYASASYDIDMLGGGEHWGPAFSRFHTNPRRAIEFEASDGKTDDMTTLVLQLVSEMIPTKKNRNLPVELHGMLLLSLLIDKVAELLRNDSLEDVSKRHRLYNACLYFVHKLGTHPELASLVQAERHSKQRSPGLEAISRSHGSGGVGMVANDTVGSVASRLNQLAKQSQIVLGTSGRGGLASAGVERSLVEMCQYIHRVYSDIAIDDRAMPGAAPKTPAERYAEFHQQNCVKRDDTIFSQRNYKFHGHASSMMYSPPGRMKRLVTELATMSTSLPLGIFVKVGEARPDMMKILIMGPPDSPYAYGLFE
jgi:baculoviral IAP repeat-containing protein 6